MMHEIIMPALGMTQDTGLIVAWRKKPGDPVKADEALFDVETDKSTVEVPAGENGFLGTIIASQGSEIPVGEVIATIVTEKSEVSGEPFTDSTNESVDSSLTAHEGENQPEKTEQKSKIEPMPLDANPRSNMRILASPKARRLALIENLDLGKLVEAGVNQPFHVRDLEQLRKLEMDSKTAHVSPVQSNVCRIVAESDISPLKKFVDRVTEETDFKINNSIIFSSFAAAGLRMDENEQILVQVNRMGETQNYLNPDLSRLHEICPIDPGNEKSANLLIRDLTETGIVSVMLQAELTPVINVIVTDNCLNLSLEFFSHQLNGDSALRLMSEITKRLESPLHYLLKI